MNYVEHGLFVSFSLQIVAAVIVYIKNGNPLSPYFLLYFGFCIITLGAITNPLIPDPLGITRSTSYVISDDGLNYILIFSLVNLAVAVLLKSGGLRPRRGVCLRLKWEKGLVFFIVLLSVAEFAVGAVLGGGIPIFVLATGEAQGGYENFRFGFLTSVTHGSVKFLFLYLVMLFAYSDLDLGEFFRRNRVLIIITLGCLVLNFLGGLRNIILLPFLFLVYVIYEHGSTSKAMRVAIMLFGVIIGLLFFVTVGSFRANSYKYSGMLLESPTNILFVDSVFSWVYLYTVPNYLNLDTVISLYSDFQYGKVFLSLIVPNAILKSINLMPSNESIVFLNENLFLAYPGLTFRTLYADLFADFGYYGSLFVGSMILLVSVLFYNFRHYSPFIMFLYFNMFKGLYYFPLKFSYLTQYDIMPILLFVVFVRFRNSLEFGKIGRVVSR